MYRWRVWVCPADGAMGGNELAHLCSAGDRPGEFQLPTDVVVDTEGNLSAGEYVGNDRISRHLPELRYLDSFGGPVAGEASLLWPQSRAIDAEDTLWVADNVHHRICRLSRDGKAAIGFRCAWDAGRAASVPLRPGVVP